MVLPMTACSTAAQAASRAAVAPPGVQFDAQPDQVLQGVDVDVPGDDWGHRGVAGDGLGGVPVQPGPALGAVVATFKDDGYSGFKEITRDGFAELIDAIEAGRVDVVIVRDIDRLTRNLTDWNACEKACVLHGVRLSAYTGGDLDLSTAECAYYGGMETLRARREKCGQERAGQRSPGPGRAQGPADRWGPALVRVYPHLRQSR